MSKPVPVAPIVQRDHAAGPEVHPAQGRRANRLAQTTSPYLLQHQFNPVNWFSWGEEAFAEARRRDVPIFLSIGYSTCYWCHVMERESFESDEMAAIMNELFVCVKVDREERPDVDDVYMAAVQAFTGHGGWPMSVFLEPATLKPFYAGTYFPSTPKYSGMPSFPQVLRGMSSAWKEQRAEVRQQAERLGEAVRERTIAPSSVVRVDESQLAQAVAQLIRIHDRVHGGFGGGGGGAPKFPQPVYLELLLAARHASGDHDTKLAIEGVLRRTLDAMALGGMFDQVGGGFHRYSVDAQWLVPHFEKMLYDNAQLAALYAQAGHDLADPFYLRVAKRTYDYVLKEMVSPEGQDGGGGGGFFAAQDAEVNHREGQNYLWTPDQIRSVLSADDAAFAIKVYSISDAGNFRDPHHPSEGGASVLALSARPEELSVSLGLSEREFLQRLDRINAQLYAARSTRDQPSTDFKVLTGWNGMMIASLALGGRVLGEQRYLDAAVRAARCVLDCSTDHASGELLRTYSKGRAHTPAFLDDYAAMIGALVQLRMSGADLDGVLLRRASDLAARAEARFADNPDAIAPGAEGGYFDTLADQSDLFVRTRSLYDGAVPSGSSLMLHAMIDLGIATSDRARFVRAASALASQSGYLAQTPLGAANSTRALLRLLTLDRASLDAALAGAPSPARSEQADPDHDQTPVEILSAAEKVELGAGESAPIVLKVRIAEGYHVNAAIPGSSPGARDLIPFKVAIVNGAGVSVFADYPKGEEVGEGDERVSVYTGEFDLTVVIERSGEWTGRPLIAITYQPCTSSACLKPRTVELDLAIDRK